MKNAYFAILLFLLLGSPAWTQSTINPAVPTQNSPLTSAPIRNNFAAAYSDINRLFNPAANSVIAAGSNVTFTGTNPVVISSTGGGGGGSPGGTSGQVQYNNAGSFGGFTLSGDASLDATTGIISVDKTLGTAFAASATSDTTNAVNIVSGILPIGRLSGSYLGITGTGTLTVGATGVGFNVDLGNSTVLGTLGTGNGGTGGTTFTANLPLIGNGGGAIGQGTRSGNTTTFATVTGSFTNGHCLQVDGSTNVVDAGGPCTTGGGGGTVSSGTAGQMTYYASTGTAVTGNGNVTISGGALTLGQASLVQGSLLLEGVTSGALTVTTQAAAGTPTWTAGTSSGTPAVTASAPLAIASATGNITVTGAAGQVLAGATPAFTSTPVLGANGSVAGTLGLANGGGSGATVTLQNLGATSAYNYNLPTTAGAIGAVGLSGGGTTNPNTWLADVATGSILISGGVGTAPSYSTTIPATTQANITQLGTVTSGAWNATAITGTYIATNTVANTNLAQMGANTLKGNSSSSTANAADLTSAQAGKILGKVLNVKTDYGAKCDGSTNDATAFQNAINDAVSGTAASGIVYIPSSVTACVINTQLNITGPISIIGDGPYTSIIQPATTIDLFSIDTTQAVLMQGFFISYASAASNGTAAIIVSSPSAQNASSVFRDLAIYNAATGIFFVKAETWVVDNVKVLNYTQYGLEVDNTNNADAGDSTVINSYMQGVSTSGTFCTLWLASGGLRFINNKCVTATDGFVVELLSGANTSQILISNNSFDGIASVAMSFVRTGTTGSIVEININGNTCSGTLICVHIPNDANGAWLTSVNIVGNNYYGLNSASAVAFEIDQVIGLQISSNIIRSTNNSTISIESPTANNIYCVIGPNLKVGTFAAGTATPCSSNQNLVTPSGI